MKRRALLLCCLALLGGVSATQAHTKSETHSIWQVAGSVLHVSFTIPLTEAIRLARPGEDQPPDERVVNYLNEHLAVTSGKQSCAKGQGRALAATTQFRRFELSFQCTTARDITLHSSFYFDLVPSHVTFAQVQTGDGQFIEQLFTKDHRDVDVSAGDAQMRDASLLEYVRLGVEHILTGPDHMSFLLGLVLISRRLRDLVFVITGFTVGHSITLALAVTGILQPHAEYIDALVALTIAVIGVENIAVVSHRSTALAAGVALPLLAMAVASFAGIGALPPLLLLGAALFCSNYLMLSGHLRDAGRLRLIVTAVFGLIHGFGFAAGLLDMQLPPSRLAQILVGFNLGVEIGQLALVFALLGVVALLRRCKLSLPRPMVVDGVAAGLVAVGTYWFVSRSFT
ncbi:MAG: HupE/UreJ family protein [Gammaproteobacteria bacterium]|nr:HupE/UreJ family protein [Gammaproteobacteria bacterium]